MEKEKQEVKGISFEELLDRINIDQAKNLSNDIIVSKLIATCLIELGKVEIKKENDADQH